MQAQSSEKTLRLLALTTVLRWYFWRIDSLLFDISFGLAGVATNAFPALASTAARSSRHGAVGGRQ